MKSDIESCAEVELELCERLKGQRILPIFCALAAEHAELKGVESAVTNSINSTSSSNSSGTSRSKNNAGNRYTIFSTTVLFSKALCKVGT